MQLSNGKIVHFNSIEAKQKFLDAQSNISRQAASFKETETQRKIEEDKQLKEERNVRIKANIKSKTKTIREVETDLPGFVDQTVFLEGAISVSSYYNYGYANTKESLFAFTIKDKTGTANVYVRRNQIGSLREHILKSNKPVVGLFHIVMPHEFYESSQGDVMAILVEWQLQTSD